MNHRETEITRNEQEYIADGYDIFSANQYAFDDQLVEEWEDGDEDWFNIGDDKDINILKADGEVKATVYPVKDGETDVLSPIASFTIKGGL